MSDKSYSSATESVRARLEEIKKINNEKNRELSEAEKKKAKEKDITKIKGEQVKPTGPQKSQKKNVSEEPGNIVEEEQPKEEVAEEPIKELREKKEVHSIEDAGKLAQEISEEELNKIESSKERGRHATIIKHIKVIDRQTGQELSKFNLIRTDSGELFPVNKEILEIGKGTADIFIDEKYISRHHAQLIQENGKLFISDLGSTNGTKINGKRLYGRTELRPGDNIMLANIPFTIQTV